MDESLRFLPTDYRDPACWLDSLWRFSSGERGGLPDYHGCYIPALPDQFIRRFTSPGDLVFDPMCGSGTTLVVAHKLGRLFTGADLSPKAVELSASNFTTIPEGSQIICADARDRILADNTVDLVMLHPPYHDIVHFGEDDRSLCRCTNEKGQSSLQYYLHDLRNVLVNMHRCLKVGGHMVVVIGDYYRKGEWVPLSNLVLHDILNLHIGNLSNSISGRFALKGIVIKDMQANRAKRGIGNLWRYRAIKSGTFLFSHESILVLKKVKR